MNEGLEKPVTNVVKAGIERDIVSQHGKQGFSQERT